MNSDELMAWGTSEDDARKQDHREIDAIRDRAAARFKKSGLTPAQAFKAIAEAQKHKHGLRLQGEMFRKA